jgi:hypothetical protein
LDNWDKKEFGSSEVAGVEETPDSGFAGSFMRNAEEPRAHILNS